HITSARGNIVQRIIMGSGFAVICKGFFIILLRPLYLFVRGANLRFHRIRIHPVEYIPFLYLIPFFEVGRYNLPAHQGRHAGSVSEPPSSLVDSSYRSVTSSPTRTARPPSSSSFISSVITRYSVPST